MQAYMGRVGTWGLDCCFSWGAQEVASAPPPSTGGENVKEISPVVVSYLKQKGGGT